MAGFFSSGAVVNLNACSAPNEAAAVVLMSRNVWPWLLFGEVGCWFYCKFWPCEELFSWTRLLILPCFWSEFCSFRPDLTDSEGCSTC